jgi:hypothetical protein
MRALGIRRTSRIARSWNRRGGARRLEARRTATANGFDSLLEENGAPSGGRPEMVDGLALDESGSLPHLDRLHAEVGAIVDERGGRHWEDFGKPFLQNILPRDAFERCPSILDFATSSEVMATVSEYFGYVPHLSGALPRGVRLMESSVRFDPRPQGPWRSSQLWHLDYHSSPTVYVIVLLRDVDLRNGPLHYLPRSVSQRAAGALDYGARRAPYRVEDEQMDRVVDRGEIRRLCAPAGTVLFIDSSGCFHFGSRNPMEDRYQLQYAYVSPIRNDFTGLLREQATYPVRDGDSRLRRMALDRGYEG